MSKSEVQTSLIFDISKTYPNRYKKDNDFLSFKDRSKSAPRIFINFTLKIASKNTFKVV